MSKAILVIERCGDCPYMRWDGEATVCSKEEEVIDPLSKDFDKYEAGYGMPDWCPLQPMPERITDLDSRTAHGISFANGWNECLDEIGGGDNG